MAIYLTHPEHGTHICYTEDDAVKHEAIGWVRKKEETPKVETIAEPVKRRGRKPKEQ